LTEFAKYCNKDTLRGFKVIQDQRICHQSKGRMGLSRSYMYLASFRSYGDSV